MGGAYTTLKQCGGQTANQPDALAQEKALLTDNEKQLIMDSWVQIKKTCPDFQRVAWTKATMQNPMLKTSFGFDSNASINDVRATASFCRAVKAADEFMNQLIVGKRLADAEIKHLCWALGVSHCLHVRKEFMPCYWDYFQVSLVDTISEWQQQQQQQTSDTNSLSNHPAGPSANTNNNTNDNSEQMDLLNLRKTHRRKRQRTLAAWVKFTKHMSELMKMGYEHHRILES